MRRHFTSLLILGMLSFAASALAAIPQTITVDGVNDFDPANLLSDDRDDTQTFCSPLIGSLDIGRVYVTNDANFLYVGVEYPRSCFCDVNLGMAFDIGTAGGGTTDPFGRRIGWANVPFKPDYVIYDVPPTNCSSFNYEAFYKDSAGSWFNRSQYINPSYGGGSNGLGIVDSVLFKELKIPLSVLGVSAGTNMHLEFWVTQEGTTKGPLDALASDDVQMSRVGQTTFDTTAVVQMTQMIAYTVLNAVDAAPPTLTSTSAVGFNLLANRTYSLNTTRIDVQFNEPVDEATAEVAANYTYSGPVTRTVTIAERDPSIPSLVHLTLNSFVTANAAAHQISVQNVKDLANNTIVNNGTSNVRGFFIQNLAVAADLSLPLCGGALLTTDTLSVEGSLGPLDFTLCNNALLYDANADSIYTGTIPFVLPRDPGTGLGEAVLEWKLVAKCSQFEDFPGNRVDTLRSGVASLTKNVAWSNQDPSQYTSIPVDVVFKVDATRRNPLPGDVITLLGSAGPLSFTQPGVPMLDNGVLPDQVAGDRIYTARVTFPACAPKNIGWKVDFNGAFECGDQGNRAVFLNDALFSSANPIVLPARGIDRCEVTDKAITVIYKVNMDVFHPPTAPTDTIAVMGDRSPLRFDYPEAAARMFDDGVAPDGAANDAVFTRAITFPDSTRFRVEFKYWRNGVFECLSVGNRAFDLDDVVNSTANPVVRLVNLWDYCSDPLSVPIGGGFQRGDASFATLRSVMPNPVSRRATFAFSLHRAGRVALNVYDVTGRRVAQIADAELPAGDHRYAWDGRSADGQRLRSGIYLYELAMGGDRLTRRLVLTR